MRPIFEIYFSQSPIQFVASIIIFFVWLPCCMALRSSFCDQWLIFSGFLFYKSYQKDFMLIRRKKVKIMCVIEKERVCLHTNITAQKKRPHATVMHGKLGDWWRLKISKAKTESIKHLLVSNGWIFNDVHLSMYGDNLKEVAFLLLSNK